MVYRVFYIYFDLWTTTGVGIISWSYRVFHVYSDIWTTGIGMFEKKNRGSNLVKHEKN